MEAMIKDFMPGSKGYIETGEKAWIANQNMNPDDSTIFIELPHGWRWQINSPSTGILVNNDNQAVAGYDLKEEILQFGSDGVTKAPGLNLWTIQEMGEKFARDNFMDEKTAARYDEFYKARGDKRKEFERDVREKLTGIIQLELSEGEWTAHVDTDKVMKLSGIASHNEITRENGIALFNRISETLHVMPLRDPLGYMKLEGNTYDYIKDQYEFQYNDTIDNIDAGFINGNGRGCEAVLDKLDATVRKNIREYVLPDGMNYQDLRHISMTDELESAVNDFVKQRVTKTVNFEKKRSHSPESLAKDHEKFMRAAENLKDTISRAAMPELDVSFSETLDTGLTQ